MKKTATLAILAAMVMMTALSCTKELNGFVDKSGDTMSLTVSATLPDYADATKNTLVNTVRVKWETGDEVYVYDNEKCLGTLTATVGDGEGKTALLSGEISTSAADKLTLVAMTDDITPSVNEKDDDVPAGGITFDLSSQSLAGAPYVAFATVDTQSGTVSNLSATFTFATSVERVNCTGLKASAAIDSVIIKGVNTQLTITPKADGVPEVVAAQGKGTITRKNADGLDEGASAVGIITFSVALLEQDAEDRKITLLQSGWPTEAMFTNGTVLESGKSYNTVCQLSFIPEYVEIKALYNGSDSTTLKWYRQNLSITESGKKAWKGGNTSSTVKVPRTYEEVIVGDYFQWAASYGGYNVTENQKFDSLLIYTSFTNKGCGESEDKFTFRSVGEGKTYRFNTSDDGNNIGISPYYSGLAYTKYNDSDKKSILDTTSTSNDDVAHLILGGDWRMPTSAEFKAMKDATYWAWDGTDQGYYVFWPGQGTNGAAGGRDAIADTDDKAAALLFFPGVGYGCNTDITAQGSGGCYWSSALAPTPYTSYAYCLSISEEDVFPESAGDRHFGFPVRPVSD